MTSTHHKEIDELLDKLTPLASQARVENAHWIVTPEGEYVSNNGNEWCFDCGSAKLKNLRKHNRKNADGYILDGGWAIDHDTPPMCAHCGVKLRASLLVYGGIYELDHFRDNPPVPGNIDHAYEVSEMLSAFQYTRSEHDGLAAEAIEIGQKLVSQLKGDRP
ncbi:hypothetical protein [Ochrobactrum sp. EDr1-4]|uniref:hypothetical protein n=1 Tax=Ochrobactrum sp. EDr1-4 TaxID=3368622 RepID=UPI003BA35DF2